MLPWNLNVGIKWPISIWCADIKQMNQWIIIIVFLFLNTLFNICTASHANPIRLFIKFRILAKFDQRHIGLANKPKLISIYASRYQLNLTYSCTRSGYVGRSCYSNFPRGDKLFFFFKAEERVKNETKMWFYVVSNTLLWFRQKKTSTISATKQVTTVNFSCKWHYSILLELRSVVLFTLIYVNVSIACAYVAVRKITFFL